MQLIAPVWRNEPGFIWANKRITGWEFCGRRWLISLGQQAAGAPIVDGSHMVLADDDDPHRNRRDYYGVAIRLNARTRGVAWCLGGRRDSMASPGWLVRHLPARLLTPRPSGHWWPPKRQRMTSCADIACPPMTPCATAEDYAERVVRDAVAQAKLTPGSLEAKWADVADRVERGRRSTKPHPGTVRPRDGGVHR